MARNKVGFKPAVAESELQEALRKQASTFDKLGVMLAGGLSEEQKALRRIARKTEGGGGGAKFKRRR